MLSAKKGILYNFGAKIVAMFCYFGLDIAVARLLGYTLYDEWNYAYSIIVICNWIMRFGIDSSTKVHIAREGEDREKQRQLFFQGLCLQIMVDAILLLLAWTAVTLGSGRLGYPAKYPDLKELLYIGTLYSALFAVLTCAKESLIGFAAFDRLLLVTAAEYIGYVAFGILGILIGRSTGLAAGYAVSALAALALARKIYPVVWRRRPGETWKNTRQMRLQIGRYALPLLLGNIGGLIATEMDTFMLGTMCRGEVGVYAVAKNMISKATNIPLAVCVVVMTPFAVIHAESLQEQGRRFWRIIGGNAAFLLGISVLMDVVVPFMIVLLYGQQYRQSGVIFLMLTPYFFFYGITLFFNHFLNYQKMARYITTATVLMVVCNLTFNLLLIPLYGAQGAAAATVLSIIPYSIVLLSGTVRFWKKTKI